MPFLPLFPFRACARWIPALAVIFLAGCATTPPDRPIQADAAPKLVEAPDPNFSFRKTQLLLVTDEPLRGRIDAALAFERDRMLLGAVNELEREQRYGHYYRFFWRSKNRANVTIRFEYRQANLGPMVQARELHYTGALDNVRSEFRVIGDDYLNDGRVTSWRALLIENGRIVASTQSALWK